MQPAPASLILERGGLDVSKLGKRLQPLHAASLSGTVEGGGPGIKLLPVKLPHGIRQRGTCFAGSQKVIGDSNEVRLLPWNSGKQPGYVTGAPRKRSPNGRGGCGTVPRRSRPTNSRGPLEAAFFELQVFSSDPRPLLPRKLEPTLSLSIHFFFG